MHACAYCVYNVVFHVVQYTVNMGAHRYQASIKNHKIYYYTKACPWAYGNVITKEVIGSTSPL